VGRLDAFDGAQFAFKKFADHSAIIADKGIGQFNLVFIAQHGEGCFQLAAPEANHQLFRIQLDSQFAKLNGKALVAQSLAVHEGSIAIKQHAFTHGSLPATTGSL
jgi:hypothetical protein